MSNTHPLTQQQILEHCEQIRQLSYGGACPYTEISARMSREQWSDKETLLIHLGVVTGEGTADFVELLETSPRA